MIRSKMQAAVIIQHLRTIEKALVRGLNQSGNDRMKEIGETLRTMTRKKAVLRRVTFP